MFNLYYFPVTEDSSQKHSTSLQNRNKMLSNGLQSKKKTSESSSSCSSSEFYDLPDCPPPAPDGGWGWMVVFASFMIHLIADGVTYTFGIFYFELLQYFSSGKALTAWVPSIMTGMTFAIGQ